MKAKTLNTFIILTSAIILFLGIYIFYGNYNSGNTIKIANWNLQIFGQAKTSDQKLINFYSSVIDNYDIIFVQEIRDKQETAFSKLCSQLTNYTCMTSSRAGRTNIKEQYGIIYKDKINLTNFYDYNPDAKDRWERPPVRADFRIKNYSLVIYNIHTDPDYVKKELDFLEDIAITTGNVIVLGDLNADCSYYDNMKEREFEDWEWLIKDREDTTVGSSNCAYDRILLNDDAYEKYKRDGIYKKQITPEMSDHYLVWVELEIG